MKKLTFIQYLMMFIIFEIIFVSLGLFALHQWSTNGGI